ncbi:MAG: sugar transferase [Sedimentisphaerales bacterium]|nr:sugar transferase [Sedimentisphaerales bacterium]
MSFYGISKRILDLLCSILGLILLMPLFIVLIILIRLTSKGPAIFTQERAGKAGKPFIFYKFRTMKTDVDPFGPSPKSGYDSRLTGVGRFLREYSLDELPQLLNIVKGDMSIVGPRPLYVSQMPEWDNRQKKRLDVRPGLTGLAQVSGRGELTREEKLELDATYVENAGILMDTKIVLSTVGQIFGRKSIYEKRYSESEHTRGCEDRQSAPPPD